MLNYLKRFRGAELLDHRLVLTNAVPVLQGRLHDLAAIHVGVTLDITVDGVEQRGVHCNADLRATSAAAPSHSTECPTFRPTIQRCARCGRPRQLSRRPACRWRSCRPAETPPPTPPPRGGGKFSGA